MENYSPSLSERFFARFEPMLDDRGCWEWTGYIIPNGYGIMGNLRRHILAHRASWAIHHGSIPNGLLVCHKCDNRTCVNPAHLFVGTFRDNNRDCMVKGRKSYLGMKGEKHPRSKLRAEQVLEIRSAALPDCHAATRLAVKYGVRYSTISNIRAGRGWKHLL